MNLKELIKQFRIEAFDQAKPHLFSDDELILWFNEAQVEACIRKQLIRENSSVPLTQFDIVPGIRSYFLDPRMFEIVYASLIYYNAFGSLPWPLGITTDAEMDGYRPFWRSLPYRPMAIIQRDSSLDVDCLPNAQYTIRVEGWRLPMWQMGLEPCREVLARGSITLTAGTDGNIESITVNNQAITGGLVPFDTDLPTTAADLVTQINAYQNRYVASSSGSIVTLTDLPSTGSLHNGFAVQIVTSGSVTATTTPIRGGMDAVEDRPEINQIHHRHLVKWALHRGYEKPDAETMNPDKSAKALTQFEQYFGTRPDADNRKKRNASTPHRNMSYA